MSELIGELEKTNLPWRPPSSATSLSGLTRFAPNLPPPMLKILERHAGMEPANVLPIRLMSPEEVLETAAQIREGEYSRFSDGVNRVLCWTDDNSNYAGIFVRGDMEGKVFFLDHEEPRDWPAFRSATSFWAAFLAAADAGAFWFEMRQDYPSRNPDDARLETPEDRALGRKYFELYQADPTGHTNQAFYALRLLGYEDTPLALRLADSLNMWIQEEACRLVGLRRYAPAVPKLKELALRGQHNGRIASILALKKINNNEARQVLAELRRELGSRWDVYFR